MMAREHEIGRPRRLDRASAALTLALALALAVRGGGSLWTLASTSARLPLWDMAQLGVGGLRVAEAARAWDLWGLLVALHDLSVWPPAYPALEAAAFLLLGSGYEVPRLVQALLWAAIAPATWWAGRSLLPPDQRRWGDAVGLAGASLFAASPFFAGYATLNLLETPALFALALCVGCYGRALDAEGAGGETERARAWRRVALTSLLLFLTKYNYGLLWIVPLAVVEGRRRAGSWRAAVLALKRPAKAMFASRIGASLALALLGVMAWVRVTGGGSFAMPGGLSLSVTSLGGPLTALALVALWGLLTPRERARRWWSSQSADPQARALTRYLAIPAGLWLLIPPHLKDFVDFVENRADGPPLGSREWWAFYPRQAAGLWTGGEGGHEAIGWAVLALAAVGLAAAWRSGDARGRLVVWSALLWASALLLHPYKLPRFGHSAFWWLGLLAALGGARILGALGARALPAALALSAGLAVASGTLGVDRDLLGQAHELRTLPASRSAVLDELAGTRPADGETVILGTWNRLSPWLLEWHARRAEASAPARRPPASTDFEISPGRRRAELIAGLEAPAVRRVVLVERERSREWAAEAAWLRPVAAWLNAPGPFCEGESVSLEGYRLRSYGRCG
ncbi:MAG: hypothetical protein AAF725_06645 [Acidobacteriota bacterium]